MTPKENESLQRINELLQEYPDERYAPHVLREDLEVLVNLIQKSAKK